jgi:hypothetical protein
MQPGGKAARVGGLALALVLAACASSPATPSPGPTATPSPSESPAAPTGLETASPPPTPSAVPTEVATPTASATPASGGPSQLTIRWVNPAGASNLADLHDIRAYAHQGSRYVIVGSHNVGSGDEETFEPAIWWSDNATLWHPASLPAGYGPDSPLCCIADVTAGGPGFVAAGGRLPLWSTDGQNWTEGTGATVDNGRLNSIGASGSSLIAFGFDDSEKPIARQSGDGKQWADASPVATLLDSSSVDFATGDVMLAFAHAGNFGSGQTAVWRMPSLGVWQQIATIGDWTQSVAFGAKGWIAVGAGGVWLSPHGFNWKRAPTQPTGEAMALVSDQAGYVAVTRIVPPGCVIDESAVIGQTWTSVDGNDWQKMKQQWNGRWLDALFTLNRELIGVGESHGTTEFGYVRTADLPGSTQSNAVAPTPQPTATPNEGCAL